MKIWYVHPYAGGPGIGRYWRPFQLSKEWGNLGHTSVVFTASYHHLLEPDCARRGRVYRDGVVYWFVPTLRYKGNRIGRIVSMFLFSILLPIIAWREAAANGKPDTIIYSSPHPFGFPACWLMARLMRAKLIFEVRDIWPLSLIEIARVRPMHPLVLVTGLIERFACRQSDRVVSLLPGAEPHLRSRGLPCGRFAWIPNGVSRVQASSCDLSSVWRDSEVVRSIDDLKRSGNLVFVYAGAHGEPNALHAFLDAVRLLKDEQVGGVSFVLIGKGEQKGELERRVREEALTAVRFFGQRSKEEVLVILSRADVGFFVMHPLPIYRFGISLNKLFDYMSCSIPVLGAYTASNDPIREAECGISVPAGDPRALAEAIKRFRALSREEREVMGKRGRLVVEQNYIYSALAARYIELMK